MEHFEQDIKGIEENRIRFYTACLETFSQFDYNDPYLEQIKQDIERIKNKSCQKDQCTASLGTRFSQGSRLGFFISNCLFNSK